MPGISRVGLDTAGGPIVSSANSSVFVNGIMVAVRGSAVAGHGQNEHAGAIMISASGSVFASGINVCRQGDSASCGHVATGSGDVFAG